MENNIWTQWFVQAVNFVLSLFASSNNLPAQSNGGALPNVPANDAATISTSSPTIENVLTITRNPSRMTKDALIGDMVFDGGWLCYSIENRALAIPAGTYRAAKRDSQHFGERVIGIDVPNRTDVECHPANRWDQLHGCVAPGTTLDSGALDNSVTAFEKVMAVVPESFTVIVQ